MKRLCIAQAVLVATLVIGANVTFAQPTCSGTPATSQVCVTPSSEAAQFAGALGTSPEQVTSDLRTQVNNLFQAGDVASFLRDFQNAQAFSSKGLGVDYASEATLVEAGATLSFASNLNKEHSPPSGSYSYPPISGGGANFSLMGGLGLGLFGLDPVMVFGNWFKGSASLGQFDGSYSNWGVHGQLRLLGPSRKSSAAKALIRWGGIAITSGADYSRATLSARESFHAAFTLPSYAAGDPQGASVQTSGSLMVSVEQTTWSVPLEVTTSLRLLSLLTVYGGLGLDFQLGGGSDLHIEMSDATLSGTAPGTTGTTNLGTASISVKQHASPSPARLREIVGLQLGIFDVIRLFVQVNTAGSSPLLTSVATGLRVGI